METEKLFVDIIKQWEPKPAEDVEEFLIENLIPFPDKVIPELDGITPECFSVKKYRDIFIVIDKLRNGGEELTRESIMEALHDNGLDDAVSSLCLSDNPSDIIGHFPIILKSIYARRTFFSLLNHAPMLLNNSSFDDFVDRFSEIISPLVGFCNYNRKLKEQNEAKQNWSKKQSFKRHYIQRGGERYLVVQSKYPPYDGICWINCKAVKEKVLLESGFEQVQ